MVDLKGEADVNSPCACTVKNLEDREHEVVLSGNSKFNIDSFMILNDDLQDDLQSSNEEFPVSMPPTPRVEPITPPPEDGKSGKGKNKTPIIIGVVVDVVVLLAIVVVVVEIVMKKKRTDTSDVDAI